MNPTAIVFWAICGIAGYFIGDETARSALMGLGVGLGISFLADLVK